MSLDQVAVLQAAEQVLYIALFYLLKTVFLKGEGMVTETGLVANLGWEARRAKLALDQLVGKIFMDTQWDTCVRMFLLNCLGGCWTGMGGQARVREGVLGGQYIHQQTIWSINYVLVPSWNVKTMLYYVQHGSHVIELLVISEVEDGGCSSSTWKEG